MNSAWNYKETLKSKKTYLISFSLALALALGLGVGAHEVIEIEEEKQAVQDSIIQDSIAQVEAKIEVEKSIKRMESSVPYIEYFKQYAPECGWEWEMLAAVGYCESRFNPRAVSPAGACGIMQMVPRTGNKYGVTRDNIFNPKDNIAASVKYIARLQNIYKDIADTTEQTKFVLASYNAGSAHIRDARKLAAKYGKDNCRWDDVEYYLRLLREPEYYRDPVVQYGCFKGTETLRYVGNVLGVYQRIKNGELNMPGAKIAFSTNITPSQKDEAKTDTTTTAAAIETAAPAEEVPAEKAATTPQAETEPAPAPAAEEAAVVE